MINDSASKHHKEDGAAPIRDQPIKPDAGYKVGPGRPPKEHQFKKGQSGNPKGAKRKAPSLAPDLKTMVQQALDREITVTQGEHKRTLSLFAAGIEQLARLHAKGDRHARKEVMELRKQLGLDACVCDKDTTTRDITEQNPKREDAGLTKEEISELSDEQLHILLAAARMRYQIQIDRATARETAEGGETNKRT
jgi:hypothetical protein